MKNPVLLLAATAALLAAAAAQDANVLGPPKIACDQPTFDFGTVDNSETVNHTFIIKNIGVSTLNISQVKPACGCTVANISSKVVEPGETSEITANLSLKGKTGRQSKYMTVYSNDPTGGGLMRLTMVGTATSELMFTPSSLNFGTLSENQQKTMEVTVKNNAAAPVKVTKVESTNNTTSYEVETVAEGKEYKVKVTNSKFLPAGRFYDSITISTDSPKVPSQRVSVFGNIGTAPVPTPPR